MPNTLNTRILLKHDTPEKWNEIPDFIPLAGEIIIYDGVNPQVKIGNGTDTIAELNFLSSEFDVISNSDIDAICGGYTEGPAAEPSNILLRSNNKTFSLTIADDGVLVITETQEV